MRNASINKIIDDHLTDESAPSVETIKELEDDLVAREQEMVGLLQEYGAKFGLLPAIVAKVIQTIGLGEEPTDEQRVYVDTQYALLLEQVKEQRESAIAAYRERGMEVVIPEFVDPLSESAGEPLVIPDAPPES